MKVKKENNIINPLDFLAYARSYEIGAKIILNEISKEIDPYDIEIFDKKLPDIRSDILEMKIYSYGLFSAIYLVRHYLELKLKGLFLDNGGNFNEIKDCHSLHSLLDKLGNLIENSRISGGIKEYIMNLHDYDSTSMELRYPYSNTGDQFILGSPDKKISNTVADRQKLVEKLKEGFEFISSELTNLEYNLDAEKK